MIYSITFETGVPAFKIPDNMLHMVKIAPNNIFTNSTSIQNHSISNIVDGTMSYWSTTDAPVYFLKLILQNK